ncbi:MAG: hypothetical protein NUV90_03140 [Candidatus Parcubacteria bacterium]|nr:hypothetical protein [Candidatus Parcubacteria bacterium]
MDWMDFELFEQEQRKLKKSKGIVPHEIGKIPIKKDPTPTPTPSVTEAPHHSLFEDYNKRS